MKIKNEQEVLQYFEKLQLDKAPEKRENYGIFVNGKRIRLSNNKVVWAKKQHASNAMRNEFERFIIPNTYGIPYSYGTPEYKAERDERIKGRTTIEELYQTMKKEGIIQFLLV